MNKKFTKYILTAASAIILGACLAGCGGEKSSESTASADNGLGGYPDHNINVIVQYSAGGGTDLSVRGVLDGVKDFPVNFSVSNVTGNAGLIGLTQVANSEPDGYTLGVLNTDFVINSVLGNTKLTVDDFSPLAAALLDPFVLIIGNNPNYSNLEEFVAYAKAHPREIKIGETGIGAAPTLAVHALENALGIQLSSVTFEGSSECVTSLVGGHIDATIAQACNATNQVKAGNAHIVGIIAKDRLKAFPDVPTFMEIFPKEVDFEMMGFCLISVPAKVDSNIQQYLSDNIRKGISSDSFKKTLESLGMQTTDMSREDMISFVKAQQELYKELINKQ